MAGSAGGPVRSGSGGGSGAPADPPYRDLVELASDLIWAVDADGRWTYLNRAATRRIYGFEPEEMIGRPFTDFQPPDLARRDREVFADIKAGAPACQLRHGAPAQGRSAGRAALQRRRAARRARRRDRNDRHRNRRDRAARGRGRASRGERAARGRGSGAHRRPRGFRGAVPPDRRGFADGDPHVPPRARRAPRLHRGEPGGGPSARARPPPVPRPDPRGGLPRERGHRDPASLPARLHPRRALERRADRLRRRAMVMQGTTIPYLEMGSASLKMNDGGSFNLLIGATDLGTGSDTVLAQMAAEVLGVPVEDVIVYSSDTDFTPFDVGAYASSTTYISGAAVARAAQQVAERIRQRAADMLDSGLESGTDSAGRRLDPAEIRLSDRKAIAPDGRSVTLAEVARHALHAQNQEQIMAVASYMSPVSPPGAATS